MPIYIFQKEKRPFSKNTLLSCPFFRKNVHSLRNIVLLCQLKKTWKTPCCHAHIWSKNVNSVKTTLYYEPKKSVWCPFFSDFSRKNHHSYAHILWKNVHSLKNTLLSSLYFVKKTSILSKTLCCYVIFSKFSWKTPCCQDHIWSKNVNSLKNTL